MKKVNAMTEKQIKEFYNRCPSGYGVEETRAFDRLSLQYITVSMRYINMTFSSPWTKFYGLFFLLLCSYMPGTVRAVYVHQSRQKSIVQHA